MINKIKKLCELVFLCIIVIALFFLSCTFFKNELSCSKDTGICVYTTKTITNEVYKEERFSIKRVFSAKVLKYKRSTLGHHSTEYSPTIRYSTGTYGAIRSINVSFNTFFRFKTYLLKPKTDFYSVSYNWELYLFFFVVLAAFIFSIQFYKKENIEEKEKEERRINNEKNSR